MPFITSNLESAIQELQAGKPVAIPTETVYGLAAMVNNTGAIQAIFSMKNRPLDHPLIVHVAPDRDLSPWIEEIPEYAHSLMKKFWPGPLTLVLRAKEGGLDPLINGGQNTVALRCPAHPLTQKLLQALECPLVAPSANPFGKISPTTALHVQEAFPGQELTILDGGRCSVGIESTIVDATCESSYQILRHGLIDAKSLGSVLSIPCSSKVSTLRVPGHLARHYQPQKILYYFECYEELARFCKQEELVYVLASQKPPAVDPELFYLLAQDFQQLAFDLYYQLRKADKSRATHIAIELPGDICEVQGVRERILKAGSPGPAKR